MNEISLLFPFIGGAAVLLWYDEVLSMLIYNHKTIPCLKFVIILVKPYNLQYFNIICFYFTGGSTLKVFCLCKTLWKHCICMAMNGYVIASYNRFVNGSLKRNCSIDRHSAWNLPGSMAKCGMRYRNKISPANQKWVFLI